MSNNERVSECVSEYLYNKNAIDIDANVRNVAVAMCWAIGGTSLSGGIQGIISCVTDKIVKIQHTILLNTLDFFA